MEISFNAEVGDRVLTIQTGKVAKQASGSVVVRYGETVVLVTVVAASDGKIGSDFLPLTVEYQEKIYAAGRIPGNYFRRELGRPSDKEILTSRLIDRPLRPLFSDGFCSETQVIATVLSMDQENEPDVLAMIGASAALEISDIPFDGPIAGVRVARIDGELVINPKISLAKKSDLNLIVAGTKSGIVMVEGGGNIVSEAELIEAIFFGHKAMQPALDLQLKLKESISPKKRSIIKLDKDLELSNRVEKIAETLLKEAIIIPEKIARYNAISAVKTKVLEELGEGYDEKRNEISEILHEVQRKLCRELIVKEERRIDGRKFDEIRPINCEVGVLPRPHGSSLFTRGETQVLGVLTLGSGPDEQRVESLTGDEFRPFMLHYNFPPFSVGEVKRLSGPSRRDIGHGALATRAIETVLPAKDKFEYTIRVVSEVLESNGSSSMATVCAATLSLMDGGVPIKAPVSGIAMGLVKEEDKVVILSDILGDEDHTGDMDFKVAGTKDGITAFQMDLKIKELSRDILEKALEQARIGRIFILDKMLEAIKEPRETTSPYAPKIYTVSVNPDKIRELIGPGGKVIRAMQSESNTRIEIDDSGSVKIYAYTKEEGEFALKLIGKITMEPIVGDTYEGKVVRIMDFGAFVEIFPGTDGLVHISQLASHRVRKVTDVVNEGDIIKVKVLEIGKDGKIRLSLKAALEEENG
ncbi:MAG: polyribonucleotide nucleotidyltransferase [Desulfobacterales bacterium]|nr:polyribonucleotide nucleotidyltransferase [Desulfobacterales bacterium]MBF0395831.1 polyribonucleotide nucleotidyltransferase [Desulfobacterales bacterium]